MLTKNKPTRNLSVEPDLLSSKQQPHLVGGTLESTRNLREGISHDANNFFVSTTT